MASKVNIGDIIEVPTKIGLAYAQYTHQHPQFGGLIRVFQSLFTQRPRDLRALANSPVRFSTFFPVAASVKRGIFEVIGNAEVTAQNQRFPVFRDGVADPRTKRVADWWLWDGQKEWKVGRLTPEQRNLPIRAVWNDTFLIERIEEGWTPLHDLE